MSAPERSGPAAGVGLLGRRAGVLEQERGALEPAGALAGQAREATGAAGDADAGKRARLLSIVIPAYNEQDNVQSVYERLLGALARVPLEWELIFSVDPCTDRTEERILELRRRDKRVKMLRLLAPLRPADGDDRRARGRWRRCGGRARLRPAGSSRADPRARRALAGRIRRRVRAAANACRRELSKRIVATAGYWVIKRIADVEIPPNTGDFRLMSRRVVDNVVALKEGHGFLRGLVGLVGFRQTSVRFDRRAAGGRARASTTTCSGRS